MLEHECGQSVSLDFAPEGSVCEWCGKPAVERLTAIGRKSHHEGGYFCHACGEQFMRDVADPKRRVVSPATSAERAALLE
jgi:DNA-directed RNA polymerase subunit RPC12/RpoP